MSTQAALITEPPTPGVIQQTLFAQESVKRLGAGDFALNSKELIALRYDDCIIALFYGENSESQQMVKVFAITAQQVAGPVFAACNILIEKKVAEAFTRLKSDGSHPLHWASLRGYPFILVYRKGWPVAFYNGTREVQALADYALTLACQANYYEPVQLAGGMQAELRIQAGTVQPYVNVPQQPPVVRTESIQFTGEQPVRGFAPPPGGSIITGPAPT